MFHGKKTLSVTADAVPAPPKGGAFNHLTVSSYKAPPFGGAVAARRLRGFFPYSSQMAVAPQGTTPPVADTGRPISSQLVSPPKRGTSVVLSIYSMTAGDRPVV